MLIGYARVSTHEQNLDLQLDALKAAGCEPRYIFTDKISTKKSADDREGLEAALKQLRSGDTFVVWRLDRLGRTLKELINFIADFGERGIGFHSLTENLDTTTPGGMLIFHIFGALAQFEREIIKQRTHAGLQAARARGRLGGRPKLADQDPKKLARAQKLYDDMDMPVAEILETLGMSKSTFYRYISKTKPNR